MAFNLQEVPVDRRTIKKALQQFGILHLSLAERGRCRSFRLVGWFNRFAQGVDGSPMLFRPSTSRRRA